MEHVLAHLKSESETTNYACRWKYCTKIFEEMSSWMNHIKVHFIKLYLKCPVSLINQTKLKFYYKLFYFFCSCVLEFVALKIVWCLIREFILVLNHSFVLLPIVLPSFQIIDIWLNTYDWNIQTRNLLAKTAVKKFKLKCNVTFTRYVVREEAYWKII